MTHQTTMAGDAFPILEFDPDRGALIEPGTLIHPRPEMPAACVLCFVACRP